MIVAQVDHGLHAEAPKSVGAAFRLQRRARSLSFTLLKFGTPAMQSLQGLPSACVGSDVGRVAQPAIISTATSAALIRKVEPRGIVQPCKQLLYCTMPLPLARDAAPPYWSGYRTTSMPYGPPPS